MATQTSETQAQDKLVTLTDSAISHVSRLIKQENKPGMGLRLGIQGGGCSGLSYKLGFDMKTDADHVLGFGEGDQLVKVYIDPKSALYLKGVELHFDDGLQGKGFQFRNPNASNTCGCGESFSI